MRIGNRWRELRERRGLSVKEAAEAIGITRDMLHKIERGDNQTKLDKIARASQLYRCRMEDLYPVENSSGSGEGDLIAAG